MEHVVFRSVAGKQIEAGKRCTVISGEGICIYSSIFIIYEKKIFSPVKSVQVSLPASDGGDNYAIRLPALLHTMTSVDSKERESLCS